MENSPKNPSLEGEILWRTKKKYKRGRSESTPDEAVANQFDQASGGTEPFIPGIPFLSDQNSSYKDRLTGTSQPGQGSQADWATTEGDDDVILDDSISYSEDKGV